MKQRTLKHPLIIAFISLYLVAVTGLGIKNARLMLSILPFSLALFALVALVLRLTKGYEVAAVPLKNPLPGLLFLFLCLALHYFTKSWSLPQIGGSWKGTSLLLKLAFLFLLPALFFRLKEESFLKSSLSPKNLREELKIALVIGAAIIIPTFFLNPATWKPLVSGERPLTQALAAFPISLLYYFLLAAIPEEFFFRAFLQECGAQFLKSRISGLIIASLIFGFLHIPGIMRWYGASLFEASARAMMVQSLIGLVFGTIYERTRSVVPLLVLHSFIDATSNLVLITQRLFG
ncbi:MAG TPA: CPBP family intramembrane metalloprotease [Chloroflexi bacterium]|nr:CPBP family intramembrane metalloprotease [Chloroflexota bacterium]